VKMETIVHRDVRLYQKPVSGSRFSSTDIGEGK
jgi:hypothetical protein